MKRKLSCRAIRKLKKSRYIHYGNRPPITKSTSVVSEQVNPIMRLLLDEGLSTMNAHDEHVRRFFGTLKKL